MSNEMLPVDAPGGIVPFGSIRPQKTYQITFDHTTASGRKMLLAGLQGECEPSDKVINTELLVEHVLVHPAQSVDEESGEISSWDRCVIYTADGRRVSFGSKGIVDSINLIAGIYGQPPWPGGVPCKVLSRAVGDKKRWLYLEPGDYDRVKATQRDAKKK